MNNLSKSSSWKRKPDTAHFPLEKGEMTQRGSAVSKKPHKKFSRLKADEKQTYGLKPTHKTEALTPQGKMYGGK